MYERKALVNDECGSKMPRAPPTAIAVPPPPGGGQALITVFVKI